MRHPQLPAILNALRQYLHRLYGHRLVNVILFGSQARNEAEPDSDIDMIVVLKGEVNSWLEIKRTGEGVAKLSLDYSVVICCVFIAETYFQAQQTALIRNVRREGVTCMTPEKLQLIDKAAIKADCDAIIKSNCY